MPNIWKSFLGLSLLMPLAIGAERERAPVAGGEIAYEVYGQGEPVLLIHGALVADAYLPLMGQAALEDYQLIRYRRRGHADSAPAKGSAEDFAAQAAADAVALLDHLDIDRAHVAGHSAGAVIALQMATDDADRVASLILMEPALFGVPSGESFGAKLQPGFEQYEAGESAAAVAFFLSVVTGEQWRETISRTVPGGVEQAKADAATFFEQEATAIIEWEFDREQVSQFDGPVAYLWGGQSGRVIGVDEIYREGRDLVQSWFPQTEEIYIEHLNHALQIQDPRAVAEVLEPFLGRHRIP